MQNVKDGVGELRIVEVPSKRAIDKAGTLTKDPGMRKMIINTLPEEATLHPETVGEEGKDVAAATAPPVKMELKDAKAVIGMKIIQGTNISGTGVQAVKGRQGVAKLVVQDGLWENRRGKKVDGGERRKEMVRAKRRAAENKNRR